MVYTNPNADMQVPTGGAQGTPLSVPPAVNGYPPAAAPQPSSPVVNVQTPQNSIGPGNVPSYSQPPAIGSVAGSLPTPQISPGTSIAAPVSYMANATAAGLPGAPAAQTPSSSSPSYQQMAQSYSAFAAANQGTQAPDSYPAQEIAQGTQTQSSDPIFSGLAASMAPIMNSLNQVISDINNPAITGQSLQQEYNQLAGQYQLPQMNAELMNMNNIMNGTQDDVASEITAAGGTATQSQILGITAARNTVIQKQYNALATQYQAAQTNVQNMMQYASTDQQTALARESQTASVTEAMDSIYQTMISTGTTMQQNALANYQKTLTTLGGDYGAFASTIPPAMQSSVESLMGLAPGTLSNPQELQLLTNSSLKLMQLQIAAQRAAVYGYNAGYPVNLPGVPGTFTTTGTSNNVVGGIDFGGAATGTQPYASNVGAEVSGVTTGYNAIVNTYGANPTTTQLQQYINSDVPNAPVTADMITSAAQQYGISPAILTATLNNETSLGTAGEATTGTNNPGGVMDPTTGKYANYPTWQDGVNASALNLSLRQVSSSGTYTGSPTTSSGASSGTPYTAAQASAVSPFSPTNPISNSPSQYTVQPTDITGTNGLRSIAAKFGITTDAGLQAVAQLNGIKDINKISVGQQLTMPVPVRDNATGETGYVSPSDFNPATYTQIGGPTVSPPASAIDTAYQAMHSQVVAAQATPISGSPLNKGRMTRNANSALKNYLASPVYTAVSSGATYLARINAAMQDPGSISDTSLADAIIKIETGGGQITDSQISTYFAGQSYADQFAVQGDKIVAKGGVLSPQQRTDLDNLAKDVFSNYQQQYEQLYVQAMQNLQGQGIPLNYGGNLPDFLSLLQSAPTTQ